MKKLIVFITAITLALHVQAQSKNVLDKDVPTIVKTEFNKAHPNAMEVGWKQLNADYIVEYTQNAFTSYAVYNTEGRIVETKDKITTFELPSTAYTYIKENYQSVPLKEYFRITDATGMVTYGVKVKDQEVVFDKKGTYLKTVDFIL